MKFLKLSVLMVALSLTQAYAQQEIAPDHFDSPASAPAVQQVQQQHQQQASSQHRNQRHNQILASKHAGKKAHSRHGRASA